MSRTAIARKYLDAGRITNTAAKLSLRVFERFPNSGLYRVSTELVKLGKKAQDETPSIAAPIYWVRISVGILIALIIGIVAPIIWAAIPQVTDITEKTSAIDLLAALEAGINELVLIGLGIFFLINLETRIKRAQAVRAVHELRSIAHVIDMHQLTKDPAVFRNPSSATPSLPKRSLTPPELIRYLDYCSELLSVTSKIAVSYVQRFRDAVVLKSVSNVETPCTGLSGKIRQKLQIAESALAEAASTNNAG